MRYLQPSRYPDPSVRGMLLLTLYLSVSYKMRIANAL